MKMGLFHLEANNMSQLATALGPFLSHNNLSI